MASPDPGVFKGADGPRSPGNANAAGALARDAASVIDLDAANPQGFDPYYRWLGIPQAEQPPTLYRLLGLSPLEPDLGVIEEAADRQMAHVRAHQKGPHADASQRLLNELAAARGTLLHVGKKLAYDRTLRPPMAPPPRPNAGIAAATPPAPPRPMPAPIPRPVPLVAPAVQQGVSGRQVSSAQPVTLVQPGAAARNYQGANAPRSPIPAPAAPRPVPVPLPVRADPSKLVLRETLADPDDDLKRFALKKAPPWAISCIIHMLVLIILGLWYIAPEAIHNGIFLDAASPELGQQLDDKSIELSQDDTIQEESVVTPADLAKVDDPFAETKPEKLEITLEGSEPAFDPAAPTINIALMGREVGMKQTLLNKYGGTGDSEDAVSRGLAWLAKQQRKEGHWSLKGPYKSGALGGRDLPESATAMALLAFLGAGHTHQKGDYQKEVANGLKALVKMQAGDGNFFQAGGSNNYWFYSHAQCTMAICEAYGMTKDKTLRGPAMQAIKYLIESQDPNLGGWRYMPRSDSDTSVTGWVVMAFQCARMAGLEVPSPVLTKVGEYLDQATEDGSLYGYQVNTEPSLTMTAEALLCRQYLGWRRDDPRLVAGADQVLKYLPRYEDRDVYYWYYGTQMMHHMEGKYWTAWNGPLRDALVKNQEMTGPDKGSWDPLGSHPDRWANLGQGGRLYTTCLSLYMLEVYYRHLPIYGMQK